MVAPQFAIVRIARVPAIFPDARALRQIPNALHQILLIVEGVQKWKQQRQHGRTALHELLILCHLAQTLQAYGANLKIAKATLTKDFVRMIDLLDKALQYGRRDPLKVKRA